MFDGVSGRRDSTAGLNQALIIGLAALALLLLLLLLLLLMIVVVVRRRRRQQKPADHEAFASPTSSTLESGSDASGSSSSTSGPSERPGQPAPDMADATTTHVDAHIHTWTGFGRTGASSQPSDPAVHRPATDPLPGLGPERPHPPGPVGRYVNVPPKLHREPRGWAPASHAVPAAVKRTWGRAKAKMFAAQDCQPDGIQ